MKFDIAHLGQTVLRYQMPLEVLKQIITIYKDKINEMPLANPQLVGKINNEKSFFL